MDTDEKRNKTIISIHAPAKGATTASVELSDNSIISIHAPAKGATASGTVTGTNLLFQSTLPRRERRHIDHIKGVTEDFNPRSREGSDWYKCSKCGGKLISIHAPAKGATYVIRRYFFQPLFQSTLPRRERQRIRYTGFKVLPISIHAPAKGATFGGIDYRITILNFNPRSREGSDRSAFYYLPYLRLFQSTLPRRERL